MEYEVITTGNDTDLASASRNSMWSFSRTPSFVTRVARSLSNTVMWKNYISKHNYKCTFEQIADPDSVFYRKWLWNQWFASDKFITSVLAHKSTPAIFTYYLEKLKEPADFYHYLKYYVHGDNVQILDTILNTLNSNKHLMYTLEFALETRSVKSVALMSERVNSKCNISHDFLWSLFLYCDGEITSTILGALGVLNEMKERDNTSINKLNKMALPSNGRVHYNMEKIIALYLCPIDDTLLCLQKWSRKLLIASAERE